MPYTPTAEQTKAIHWYAAQLLAGQKRPGAANIIQHELLNSPDAEERVAKIMVDYTNVSRTGLETTGRGRF